MLQSRFVRYALIAAAWGWSCGRIPQSPAAEVTLKNGTVLEGYASSLQNLMTGPGKKSTLPIDYNPILLVSNDLQRYFVPARQLAGNNKDADLSKYETFTLSQQSRGRSEVIGSIGSFDATAFDVYGRRTVTLHLAGGKKFNAIQGITKITPQYVKITGLNCEWNTALATSSVPLNILDGMLRHATKPNNPDHRLGIARFYLQAGMYGQAQQELAAIRVQFKELVDTVDEVRVSLTQLQAQQLLEELRRLQTAGQHRRAYENSKAFVHELTRFHAAGDQTSAADPSPRFPLENVSAAVLREVRELSDQYDRQREQAEQAILLMGELQAALPSKTHIEEVAPLRSEIAEKLNCENLERLDPFLKLAKANNLKPGDKLALALSGWVLGSPNAITDLDLAIRLWKARFLILNYLRTEGQNERKAILSKLLGVEGVGPDRIVQLLPLLPTILETDVKPGVATTLQAGKPNDKSPVAYSVLLPPEYHADHTYPLIIALHGPGPTGFKELEFWGGTAERPLQSQRLGYIVIAPAYAEAAQGGYDYGPSAHRAVIESLNDARLRFSIDSDRVYLSGHGMGGDAAFDIGLSHPDLFAGVIPFTGIGEKFSRIYWENGKDLPFYAVGGELDRDSRDRNAPLFMEMMTHGYDLIYTEYKGCGDESFYAEIHKLFTWMGRHKRTKFPKQIEARTRRATDNRFWWLEVNGLPAGVTAVDWTSDQRKPIRPITAKVTDGNTLHLSSGAKVNTIWLAPDFVDFGKRLSVRVNGVVKWNNFIKPDIEAMLEDQRRRGDRQQVFWAVLEF